MLRVFDLVCLTWHLWKSLLPLNLVIVWMAVVAGVGLRIWIVVHFVVVVVVVVETAELELAVAEYSEVDVFVAQDCGVPAKNETVHHAVVADMVAVDV